MIGGMNLLRAGVETGVLISAVYSSRYFIPSSEWKKEKDVKLATKEGKLHRQTRNMALEAKHLSNTLYTRYYETARFALGRNEKTSQRKICSEDLNEFLLDILGPDSDLVQDLIQSSPTELEKSVPSGKIVDALRIIPRERIEEILKSDIPSHNSFLVYLISLTAHIDGLDQELGEIFHSHHNCIHRIFYNRLVGDVIGPQESLDLVLTRLTSSLLLFIIGSNALNIIWPLTHQIQPTLFSNTILNSLMALFNTRTPKFPRLPFGSGLVLTAATALLYFSVAPDTEEIRQKHLYGNYWVNENLEESQGSQQAATRNIQNLLPQLRVHPPLPIVPLGATAADPYTTQRVKGYALYGPFFQELLLRYLLFSRLMLLGTPALAYLGTTLAAVACFPDHLPDGDLRGISSMERDIAGDSFDERDASSNPVDVAIAASFSLMCSAAYHYSGNLLAPLLVHIVRNCSILLAEFEGREDVQLERVGVYALVVGVGAYISYVEDVYLLLKKRLRDGGLLSQLPLASKDTETPAVKLKRIADRAIDVYAAHGNSSKSSNSNSSTSNKSTNSGSRSSGVVKQPTEAKAISHPDDLYDFMTAFLFALEGRSPGKILEIKGRDKDDDSPPHPGTIEHAVHVQNALTEVYTYDAETTKFLVIARVLRFLGLNPSVTADMLVTFMEMWLSTDEAELLASLDLDKLYRETFRWEGAGLTSDPALREELQHLMQRYYTRMMKADLDAATELVRIRGPAFIASLAGRQPTREDFQEYHREGVIWRRTCLKREAAAMLGDVGLTMHRFIFIVSRASRRFDEVKKLHEDWMNYFSSDEYNNKWMKLADPMQAVTELVRHVDDGDAKVELELELELEERREAGRNGSEE